MIYLLGMLQNTNIVFLVLATLIGVLLPLYVLFMVDDGNEFKCLIKFPLFKLAVGVFVFSICWIMFVPSRNTVIAMYAIPKIVHNEQISHLSELGIKSTVKYLNTYLESQNSKQ